MGRFISRYSMMFTNSWRGPATVKSRPGLTFLRSRASIQTPATRSAAEHIVRTTDRIAKAPSDGSATGPAKKPQGPSSPDQSALCPALS
jgi:hypothetical protein